MIASDLKLQEDKQFSNVLDLNEHMQIALEESAHETLGKVKNKRLNKKMWQSEEVEKAREKRQQCVAKRENVRKLAAKEKRVVRDEKRKEIGNISEL